jgi:hypothetical protein
MFTNTANRAPLSEVARTPPRTKLFNGFLNKTPIQPKCEQLPRQTKRLN